MATLQELLLRSSRTFAVGIDLLPEPLRGEITLAYLLLRVSDYLEDSEVLADGDKIAMLEDWRRALADRDERAAMIARLGEAREDTPDALVARDAETVLEGLDRMEPRAREIVVRRVRESTAGMARWTRRGSVFHSEADLDDYMHEVAGRVGLLLTELFALRLSGVARSEERMMGLGREFGLALQTVNVIRGLHEDPRRDWVFVPRSFVPEELQSPRAIFDPSNVEAGMGVVARLAAKADGHLAAARQYVRLIPRRHHRVRLFCLLPLFFAIRTLAVSRSNPDVLRAEVKMTRDEVRAITRHARVMGVSNRWIGWYCRRLAG